MDGVSFGRLISSLSPQIWHLHVWTKIGKSFIICTKEGNKRSNWIGNKLSFIWYTPRCVIQQYNTHWFYYHFASSFFFLFFLTRRVHSILEYSLLTFCRPTALNRASATPIECKVPKVKLTRMFWFDLEIQVTSINSICRKLTENGKRNEWWPSASSMLSYCKPLQNQQRTASIFAKSARMHSHMRALIHC